MGLLKVKAWVCQLTEDAIEKQLLGELESIGPDDKFLAWRDLSQPTADIKNILQYDRERSIIITWDEERIIVKAKHQDLHKEWQKFYEEDRNAQQENLAASAEAEVEGEEEGYGDEDEE